MTERVGGGVDIPLALGSGEATLSLDYEVADDMTLGAACRYGREGGEDDHTIGLLFAYGFSIGGR